MDSRSQYECNPVVKAVNIWFRYGEEYVLRNITLEVYRKDLVIIMGPNGAGKSTLLKVLTGVLKPEKGDVYICDYNTRDRDIEYFAKFIGYLHQNPWFYIFNPRVIDEIAFTARNLGINEDSINRSILDIATKLEIADLLDRSPFTLSEGEIRRVVIAASLIHKPIMLLMDEPTAGLDYTLKKKFIEIINGLIKGIGVAVIIATHDIDILRMLPWAKLIILSNGEIVYSGIVDEAMKNPETLRRYGLTVPIEVELSLHLDIDWLKLHNFDDLLLNLEDLRDKICR